MTLEIKTFSIPDDQPDGAQADLAAFLRTVEVSRIDTAYAPGAWRVLVLYQDLRRKEESQQIEASIAAALGLWRDRTATTEDLSRDAVLPDDLLQEIARFAPTTGHELSIILGTRSSDFDARAPEIVQVVRTTLEELID
ncbi:ribonuclease D [Azospirillum fermentarium]|uniref:HRDC domain-containing protein n=1 Tax=Azospirillum fermentarium TaxID=1233114 RepID=UPI0022276E2E|nr:HRDC domain-containing protein [Azospirillum fermentarium]MCW2245922.1 ribonuclease D [Azospirillum fermentarium]